MRLPRPTIRRAMILVAVVALTLGGPAEVRRLNRYRVGYKDRALRYSKQVERARQDAMRSREDWITLIQSIDREERASRGWARASRPYPPEKAKIMIPYFETLRLKYDHAASYPWLPVEPDPPGPE